MATDDTGKSPDAPEPDTGSSPGSGQPPIPDGGLGTSMPDWLQRPPAWRGMGDRSLEKRDLPPPDTSVIDPRTMLDIGDLPQWLQRIAARAEDSGTTVTGVSEAEVSPPPAPTGPAATETPPDIAESLSTSIQEQSPEIVLLPAAMKQAEAWWRSGAVLKGLAVMAILLGILVWIILVAA